MQIRDERPEDAAAIAAITTEAFAGAAHAGGNEDAIIDALRLSGALTLSLVATDKGEVLGHVAFSPVRLEGRPSGPSGHWYALGPVSVRPDRQRRGLGVALIQAGLARLRHRGAQGCVLTGEPAYYERFGFRSSEALTYAGHASPYLQGLAFDGSPPYGDVVFDPAFGLP
ncbi:MAG: GNAT family N-acetyltransferase [Novosphingobium sp.]